MSQSVRSIRRILVLWLSVGICFVMLVLGYFMYQSQLLQFRQSWISKLEADLGVLRVTLQEQMSDGEWNLADQTLTRMGVEPHVAYMSLVIDGKVRSSTRRSEVGSDYSPGWDAFPANSAEYHHVIRGSDIAAVMPLVYRGEDLREQHHATLHARYDASVDLRAVYRNVVLKTAIVMAIISVFIIGLVRTIRRVIMKPMAVLAGFARDLARGHYGKQLQMTGAAEFLQLETAFNELSAGLERSTRQLQDQAVRDHAFSQAFPDTAFLLDHDGRVASRYGNESAAVMGPQTGRWFWHWLVDAEAERQRQAHRQVLNDGEMVITEFRHEEFYVESRMAPLVTVDQQGVSQVQGVLWLIRDISEVKRQQKTIEHQANFDSLTDLANRRYALLHIEKRIAAAKRTGGSGSVLFIDLDHFANINDALGHPVGDRLLVALGERLQSLCRTEDVVARLGGDEFLVIPGDLHASPDIAASEACEMAERLLAMIRVPFDVDEHRFMLSASVGVAVYPVDSCDAHDVIRQADTAMYSAKDKGRDTVSVYTDSMLAENQEKLQLYSNLRMAIARGDFHLAFQPQFDANDCMIGAEVLVRWTHDGKPIFPDKFIKAAEDTNQILALGRWILRESLQTLKALQQRGSLPPQFRKLAINISAMQFVDPWFEDVLFEEMQAAGLEPGAVELELTESVFVGDKHVVREKMLRLSDRGYAFALDDFGTGYSSLSYLQNLPIAKLKIDRSFVMDIGGQGAPARIVDSIIQLGRNLSMDVLAEGVETATQRDYLRERGCSLYQGYYFARPLTVADFEALAIRVAQGVKR